MFSRRHYLILIGVAISLAALVACGSSEGAPATISAPAPTATSAPGATATPTPPEPTATPEPEAPPTTIGTVREFPVELLSTSPKLQKEESDALWEAFLSDVRIIGGQDQSTIVDLCSELTGGSNEFFSWREHTGYLHSAGAAYPFFGDRSALEWAVGVSRASSWNNATLSVWPADGPDDGGAQVPAFPPDDANGAPPLLGGMDGDIVLELADLPDSACGA